MGSSAFQSCTPAGTGAGDGGPQAGPHQPLPRPRPRPGVKSPGVAAAGHADGGSLSILQVTEICLGQVPAKGTKQDPWSQSCPPASVRGKAQVRKTWLRSAGQGGVWEGGVAASFGERGAAKKQPSPPEIQPRCSAQGPFGCSVLPLPRGSPRDPPPGRLRGHLC